MTNYRESVVEAHLRQSCQRYGAVCLKLTTLAGLPDRLILWPGGKVTLVELKRPSGGKVSARQVATMERLRRNGFTAKVVVNIREVDELLEQEKPE